MDGRVKTLHPKVHGACSPPRHPGDRAALAEHGITPIDLVVVNLYPFRETVAKLGVAFEQAIEQIDIGALDAPLSGEESPRRVRGRGPGRLSRVSRAEGGRTDPGASPALRKELAAKVFPTPLRTMPRSTATSPRTRPGGPSASRSRWSASRSCATGRTRTRPRALRDGGARHRDLEQLSGKELSSTTCWTWTRSPGDRAVERWPGDRAACAIIKHTTPCGIALGRSPREAYERALATDRTSVRIGDRLHRGGGPRGGGGDAGAVRRGGGGTRVRDEAIAVFREKKNCRGAAPGRRASGGVGTGSGFGAGSSRSSAPASIE